MITEPSHSLNHHQSPEQDQWDDPSPAKPGRRLRPYQQPAEMAARSAGEAMYLVALAVAAGADVAAFFQVLERTLAALSQTLVWLAVAGFTVMSLMMAQVAGRLQRDRAAGYGAVGRWSAALVLIPWFLLGLAALLARLIIARGDANNSDTNAAAEALSGAILFFVLYLASGAVAGFGEYLTRNPLRARYRAAERVYHRAQRRLARSQPPYEFALSVWEQHERTLRGEAADYHAADDLRKAQGSELKDRAAFYIAAFLQDPAATDGMTLPDRSPRPFTAPSADPTDPEE